MPYIEDREWARPDPQNRGPTANPPSGSTVNAPATQNDSEAPPGLFTTFDPTGTRWEGYLMICPSDATSDPAHPYAQVSQRTLKVLNCACKTSATNQPKFNLMAEARVLSNGFGGFQVDTTLPTRTITGQASRELRHRSPFSCGRIERGTFILQYFRTVDDCEAKKASLSSSGQDLRFRYRTPTGIWTWET